MNILFLVVLWIHAFTAVFFIGGSFFIWLIVWPATFRISDDEKDRTRIIGNVGRLFGTATDISVGILIITGLFLAYEYLPSLADLTTTTGGKLLLTKGILVVVMLVIMYTNNIYHGKKIVRLSREGKTEEIKKIRKVTHMASFITLALMGAIAVIAFTLPFYHP
ncbi:MAG: CopD family protein [Candidatus Thermoplasmatota archaeon]|nr:CopD family protein [Candidatus Thermoplasmatota archaeon]